MHATPKFFALIHITRDCKIVRNLSFPASGEPIALVYLSANSHAFTKSTHFEPKLQAIVLLDLLQVQMEPGL